MRERLVIALLTLFCWALPLQADLYTFEGTIMNISDPGGLASRYAVNDTFRYYMLIDFDAEGYWDSPTGTGYLSDSSDTVVPHTYECDYFYADTMQTLMDGEPLETEEHWGMDYSRTFHTRHDYYVPYPWPGHYEYYYTVDSQYYTGRLHAGDGGLDGQVVIERNNWRYYPRALVSNWAVGDTFSAYEYGYAAAGHSTITSRLRLTSIESGAMDYSSVVPVPAALLLGTLGLGTGTFGLRRWHRRTVA